MFYYEYGEPGQLLRYRSCTFPLAPHIPINAARIISDFCYASCRALISPTSKRFFAAKSFAVSPPPRRWADEPPAAAARRSPNVHHINTYAAGKEGGAPYQTSIAQPEAKLWATTAAAGQKIIPTVSAGWDNRPRINTCPWGNGRSVLSLHIFQILSIQCSPLSLTSSPSRLPIHLPSSFSFSYTVDPTMAELEAHTAAGLAFVAKNRAEATEANMLMLSAWNEHDEGHWIEPTLEKFGGAEKLEAVRRAIEKQQSSS